ncbi:MAG: ATP-dependent RecD-like DNA helicase [Candidatus Eremiobacteraeota bacterium]|nr:ATP-dependent RecD-like DNA helicase [Candidatus Eremiobacteraeota bacterium]
MTNNTSDNNSDNTTTLKGTIHKIVFHSDKTGFTVARFTVGGQKEPVTVVGKIASLNPGCSVEFTGRWGKHNKYGSQFQADSYLELKPGTIEGIRKYLGSGLIKGIGPVYARKLVDKFGLETLDVIENQTERILEIPGIGRKRTGMILTAWKEQKNIRNIMIFLQGHGVGPARAVKIYKTYGDSAVEKVKENPYRLAEDIWGIGFKVADGIARNIGFEMDSPHRARAAIFHVLNKAAESGHCFLPMKDLQDKCVDGLEIPKNIFIEVLDKLVTGERLEFEDDNIYLKRYYYSEMKSASALVEIMKTLRCKPPIDPEKALRWVQDKIDIKLSNSQSNALKITLSNKVSIITGGPGVGKTTILLALVTILERAGWKISLCAPTGRAAKRMSEAIGREAKTIHRLLKYKPGENKFEYDGSSRLPVDCVIVDEMSMVDVTLFYDLLVAIPPEATVLLVGDVDQLPSVGAGAVLKDLIESHRIPVARLNEIFRQKEGSLIIKNAHRVNRGEIPITPESDKSKLLDFYFVRVEDPEKAQDVIIKTVTERIPGRFHLDPMRDVQVISPMAKRVLGAGILNEKLQEAQNPNPTQATVFGRDFRVGDKVMQIRNNYEKEVFNGDIGIIMGIDPTGQNMSVNFDGNNVEYEFNELDEIVLAYACTVHKSQGSEFPAVVMPLYTGHYVLLRRNLLYTAITRAKKLVVLVGSAKALAIAVKNAHVEERNTTLKKRIMSVI